MKEKKVSNKQIEDWVKRAKKGHEKSFSLLYDALFPDIFRYVSFRINYEFVEDVVSDIFFKVVHSLKKYEAQKNASFRNWVYKIAHNQIIDFYKKQKNILGVEVDDNFFINIPDEKSSDPNKNLMKKEESQKIKQILKKLPQTHREILELKFLDDFSNKEISKITGKSEGNIRIIQLRALREMRKYFTFLFLFFLLSSIA